MKKRSLSIKYKIIIISVISIFISSILISLFSYGMISGYLEEKAYENKVNTMVQAAKTMTEKGTNLVKQTQIILENDSFHNTLEEIILNPRYNYAKAQSNLQQLFQSIAMKDRAFEYFYLYTDHGDFSSLHKSATFNEVFNQDYMLEKLRETGLIVWEDDYFVLLIPKRFSYTGDALMFVKLDQHYLRDYLYDIDQNICITNQQGKVIIGKADTDVSYLENNEVFIKNINSNEPGYFKTTVNGEEQIVFYANIERMGWCVVSVEPTWKIVSEIKYFNRIFQLALLLALIVSAIFSLIVRKVIIKPLNQLTASMDAVKGGNLGVRFNSVTRDEIGLVGENFNYMLDEIENLIIKVEKEQEGLRKMETDLLQSQINPHFLYNTLDTIYWKICLEDYEVAKKTVLWLGKFLRIGLSKGNEKITIKEELTHIEHFLKLQQMLYNKNFTYHIECPENLEKYKVVKIILQPLIENSVNHGFRNLDEKGVIKIKVSEIEESKLEILLVDNGTGIDMSKIPEGFGLRNTIKRLKLHYGEGFGLFIYPQDIGVLIRIVIPKEI